MLAASLVLDCDNPPLAGLESRIYLFNLVDKDSITTVGGGDNTITAISLAATKLAYKWEGGTDFINGTWNLRTSRILNGFGHVIDIVSPEDDQAALTEIANLANGRICAVVLKRGNTENTARVYGIKHGLELTTADGDESNQDTAGLPSLQLTTPENYQEPLPPQHMLVTDYAGTVAALEALLV